VLTQLLKRLIVKPFRRLPLQLIVIAPAIALVPITAGLIGWLYWHNGQQAWERSAFQVQEQLTERVRQHLDTLLSEADLLNHLNGDAMALGHYSFDRQDPRVVQQYFWQQLQRFHAVSLIEWNTQGNRIGVWRRADETYQLYHSSQTELNDGHGAYEISNETNSGISNRINNEINSGINYSGHFDQSPAVVLHQTPANRSWYHTVAQAGKPIWHVLDQIIENQPQPTVTTGLPIYDPQGSLQGVLGCSVLLRQIDLVLQQMTIDRPELVFIMERSGQLIASSQPAPVDRLAGTQTAAIQTAAIQTAAITSHNAVQQSTVQHLIDTFGNFSHIDQRQLKLTTANAVQLIQVLPYQNRAGLDWLIVSVMPEFAITSPVQIDTHPIIALCLGVVGLASLIGFVIAGWMVRSLRQINAALQATARGDLDQRLSATNPVNELNDIALSFNQMVEQLDDSFKRMHVGWRESEEKFTKVFQNSPDPIVLTTMNGGKFVDVNHSFLNLLGYARNDVIGRTATEIGLWNSLESRDRFIQALREHGAIYNWECNLRTQSGEIKTMLLSAEIIDLDGQPCVIVIDKDITDRKRAEETLRLKAQREQALNRVIQAIHNSLDLPIVFSTAASEIARLLQAERTLIMRYQANEQFWVIVSDYQQNLNLSSAMNLKFPAQGNKLMIRLKQLKTIRIDDISTSKEIMHQTLAQLSSGSWLLLPLHLNATLWGCLSLSRTSSPSPWRDWEVELAEVITAQVAIAIQQSELYQQVQIANQRLERLATLDSLTQVANRRYFDHYLNQEWNRLMRIRSPLSLILCDVDYFKRYNDTYGHLAGDDCLRQIAQAISHATERPADLVARYGGEEFAVILPATDCDGAARVAEKIQATIQQLQITHLSSDTKNYVTLSLGMATLCPDRDRSPQELIAAADQALYQAKVGGRNACCISNIQ
jgi:diguanylate cyclase (GGDEF)-like protein/PAS domain S-box-containing protein